MRRNALPLLVVVATAALWPSLTAQASMLRRLTMEQMVIASPLIVEGEVAATRVEVRNDVPFTFTTVTVSQRYKGDAPDGGTLTIRQRGGRVGDLELWAEGDPRLVPGDRCILYLLPSEGDYVLTGMAQGVARVKTDRGETYVVNEAATPRLDMTTYQVDQGPILSPTNYSRYVDSLTLLVRKTSGVKE